MDEECTNDIFCAYCIFANEQADDVNTMAFNPVVAEAVPRWRQAQRRLGRNSSVLLKVLTAALFCITLVSITSDSLLKQPVRDDQKRPPAQVIAQVLRTLQMPPIAGPPPIEQLEVIEEAPEESVDEQEPWQSSPPITEDTSHHADDTSLQNELFFPVPNPDEATRPILIKLMMLTSWDQSAYERAIRLHAHHSRLHNYPMSVLRQPILSDVWTKPAYILSCLLRELAKPLGVRAGWLFWFDADTIILNPNVPLDGFLPPATLDDINLMVGFDWNGLNNGVYPIRVHPWSVELMTAILTYPIYRPDEELPLRDQSAMAEVLKMPRFKRHTAVVPMRWFDGYHRVINESADHMMARPGDLLVHLAGVPERFAVMEEYLQKANQHLPEYEIPYKDTAYDQDIKQFWRDFVEERKQTDTELRSLESEANDLEHGFEEILQAARDGLKPLDARRMKYIEILLERKYKVFDDFYMKQDLATVRDVVAQLREVCLRRPVRSRLSSHTNHTRFRYPNSSSDNKSSTPDLLMTKRSVRLDWPVNYVANLGCIRLGSARIMMVLL